MEITPTEWQQEGAKHERDRVIKMIDDRLEFLGDNRYAHVGVLELNKLKKE